MIDKRLLRYFSESKKAIAKVVGLKFLLLVLNSLATGLMVYALRLFFTESAWQKPLSFAVAGSLIIYLLRFVVAKKEVRLAYGASASVKEKMRTRLFQKLMGFGVYYKERLRSAEAVQIIGEGIDQLEIYFSAYLPQFFYSMIAPIFLFFVIGSMSWTVAIVLLIGVPLIPLAIALIQTFAKKTFAKYWTEYTDVGDEFLENLQGLTTLKIYGTDPYRHRQMEKSAESFRVQTMRVLTMQLNSIIVMDLVAYGGAAIALVVCLKACMAGRLDFFDALFILLLSADYFLPMRQLGSFFHIAMNGMAAADRMFDLLALEEEEDGTLSMAAADELTAENLSLSYDGEKKALDQLSFDIKGPQLVGIVGPSGSGKSTLAAVLSKQLKGYTGSLAFSHVELSQTKEKSLLDNVTYLGAESYIMGASVRELLAMANPRASEEAMWDSLDRVNLKEYFAGEAGLDTMIQSGGSNLSGGQRQRLSLAMALLHDTPIYIFDEVTSNIDVESEEKIVGEIRALAETRLVLFISHRLANVKDAGRLLVLNQGHLVEEGRHEELLEKGGMYGDLWKTQAELEQYRGGEVYA
ncbi:ABC transporter ATP-binding protein/permease [Peptoniphilus sp. EMRHCC_23]|uniref:ABC transporter ATP-binding protein/permease n=1 Tax=Peptoniphilus rachelemmaiella TaxID=2811779 RepID=UPI001BFFE655|nr:ABC transporter ATP-binding protein/permease [Peptoniphilus rachelemmaiella]